MAPNENARMSARLTFELPAAGARRFAKGKQRPDKIKHVNRCDIKLARQARTERVG